MSTTTSDFNNNHPELRENEIFLTNIFFGIKRYDGINDKFETRFENIMYKTKRAGNTAYKLNGEIIDNAHPVFIDKEEYHDRFNRIRRIINKTE